MRKRLHLIIYILFFLSSMPAHAQKSVFRKLSPSLRQLIFQQESSSSKRHNVKGEAFREATLCAFVKAEDDVDSLFSANNAKQLAKVDDIYIVDIPMTRVKSLSEDRRIHRIEAGRGMSLHNHHMARHLNINGVYKGTNLPQAYSGRGVVMGIQDVGFDLTNPNFYSSDMSDYRIRSFWDMLSADTVNSGQYVGRAYEGRDAILQYAHSRDGLKLAHGSHTLGTAAGSGFGSPYRGVAYDADICIVNNAVSEDKEFIADADQDKYTYATDALGFKYIFDYAERVNKPCVISFSEGSMQDLYGENILYNELLERLTGPGRIIVASAGNSSHNPSYMYKPVGKHSVGTFIESWDGRCYFMSTGTADFSTRMVFYGADNDTLTVSSEWLCQQTDSLHSDTLRIANSDYVITEGAYPDCYNPDRLVVEIYITGPDHLGGAGNPISVEIVGEGAETETYLQSGYFVKKSRNPTLADARVGKNIKAPGSLPSVICVGATAYSTGFVNMYGNAINYNFGIDGKRSTFSSIGPTFDGRVKPDVMAPGTNIISSTNSFFFEANPDSRQKDNLVSSYEHAGRTYFWKADNGTSMSSPAVGGAIALWLEANPNLTPHDVLDVLAHTSSHPDPLLNYPNNEYGYGQIDVYRGLLYILGVDAVEGISHNQAEQLQYRINNDGSFSVVFPEQLDETADIKVYNTSGQLLLTDAAVVGTNEKRVSLPERVSGVVVVQVNGKTPKTTGSTLLRL